MITPQSAISDILNCFGTKIPETVILGGSYATNEYSMITYDQKVYMLSDFDLLCITDKPYTNSDKIRIYKNMLLYIQNLNQANPYFHIGLKIRSKTELKCEVDTLYFKELSTVGKTLVGKDFLSFFDAGTKFSFADNPSNFSLYQKLSKSGMMRIWCNLLFFPLNLLSNAREIHEPLSIWYSYFIARGMMDWVTFELIENNIWSDTYFGRFEKYKKICQQKHILELSKIAIDIKFGKSTMDWKTIFIPIISFSLGRLADYCKKSNMFENNYELGFLRNMSEYLISYISKKKPNEYLLSMAKSCLDRLIKSNVELVDMGWTLWHRLRSEYSNYKFSLDEKYRIDHVVYTNYFLRMGDQL